MTVAEDTRVVDTGRLQKIKFTAKPVKPREFRVTLEQPLAPGEYAFFHADTRRGGGSPATVWDFSVRER
jgi:hypothetical protein